MLQNLHVKNLALIDEVEITFDEHLNILTGETGAGKSVLIGSIESALGKKISKDMIRPGAKEAVIEQFYMTDDRGAESKSIIKGSEFTIHMKVRFMADLPAPISRTSIKTVKGTEITGTNTMFEKAFLEPVKAGAVKDITFTQKMSLQGGEYLLSFGVTGYDGNDFQVYHRLYDALDLTVISDKNTVGFYDMDSKVMVKDAE